LKYKKDVIRPMLSPLRNRDPSELKSIDISFTKAKEELLSELYDLQREFPASFYNDYDPYISTEEINKQIDINDELRMYSTLMRNSEEEGWFYPDHDETLIDSIVGSR